MTNLLVINSSARVTRSITRHLTGHFVEQFLQRRPDATILCRDVGLNPPPIIDEAWIAAAFAGPAALTPEMEQSLAVSEELISEVERADAIVIGAPIYNFGLPAALKATVDQIVRVGRTVKFDPTAADPYEPLLASKPVVVMVSAGDGEMHPGGKLESLNHLEPHLRTALGFIGLHDLEFVRAGYDEYGGERARRSLAQAEAAARAALDRVLDRMAASSQVGRTSLAT